MSTIHLISDQEIVIEKWRPLLALDHNIEVYRQYPVVISDNPNIIIVQTTFVDNNALDIANIKKSPCKFLIIGDHWPEENQVAVLVAGAAGYCDCNESTSVILKAVESILQGDIWMQRHLITKVIGSLVQMTNTQSPVPVTNASKLDCLSSRELDVARLIRQGVCNKDIASKLFISERTVKAHLTSIFAKLNVTNRLHLGILLKEVDE